MMQVNGKQPPEEQEENEESIQQVPLEEDGEEEPACEPEIDPFGHWDD